ncbi:MAG: TolC family protein [Candidatus Sedimenticola sp. 20ELBAFRAG]
MNPFSRLLLVLLTASSLSPIGAIADEGALPEPLTLAHALSLADDAHPELEQHRARLDGSIAYGDEMDAADDLKFGLEAHLRVVEPSYKATNTSRNDSRIKLKLQKKLYDFGRTDAALQAAEYTRRGSHWDYIDARQKRRLEIMDNFFEVILSDIQYLRDNEVMTMSFLRWKKLQDTEETGKVSDIDLLEKESIFRRELKKRSLTENMQRVSRARLAISLNRPDQLSSELDPPVLEVLKREAGDVDELTRLALENNPHLKALKARVTAAEQDVEYARAGGGPTIRGEVEASAYNKMTGTRDPLAAALILELPLSAGSAVDAVVARKRAVLRERRASLLQAERDVRQTVLELWLELKSLKLQMSEMEALGDYRELYLDRSRALYELEVKSDLGDAESRIVDAQLQKARTEFDTALAWARLDALLGRLVSVEAQVTKGEEE